MCPVCVATTLTLIAGSVTASSGVAALVTKILQSKPSTNPDQTTECEENENESSAI